MTQNTSKKLIIDLKCFSNSHLPPKSEVKLFVSSTILLLHLFLPTQHQANDFIDIQQPAHWAQSLLLATMERPTCAVCQKISTFKCSICDSASYCSDVCQKKDLALYGLLCSKLESFIKDNPRPDNMHKLALLFPEKADLPQLIWVETEPYHEEDEDGNLYVHSIGCKLNQHVGSFPRPLHIDPNPYKLQIYADDMLDKFEGNQCLSHLTKGYASRDLASGMISAYDWNGHRAVVGFAEQGKDGQVAKYRDVTLDDLRGAFDALSQNMNMFEDDKPNTFVIRDEDKWTKAVKVSCEGDVKFLGKEKYRQVEIRKNHPIFFKCHGISTISRHMGWTLLAKKCEIDPAWMFKARQLTKFDPLENCEAWGVLYNADPIAAMGDWGQVNFPTWNGPSDQTVLFARKDKKDVTKYQIEVLSSYCRDVAFHKMDDENYAWGKEERMVIINKFFTADAFDNYFHGYANAMYNTGHREWGTHEGQDSGCDTSSDDLLEAVQGLSVDDSDE